MGFKEYKGSIKLGAGLTPSGEGYPLMQTSDILAEAGGKRLDVLLAEYAEMISSGTGPPAVDLTEEIAQQENLVARIKIALQEKMSAVGIASIEKTSTVGLVDTYTITFTDGTTTTFNVTNGADGENVDINIHNGVGEGSLQQVSDPYGDNGVYTETDGKEYFAMSTTIHPYAPYKTGDHIPFGAIGHYSKAFTGKSSSQGKRSTSEGTTTIALGDYSHAEGNTTVAEGASSHSEGIGTYAKGDFSHASGNKTIAFGEATLTSGDNVIAHGKGSVAFGTGKTVYKKDGTIDTDASKGISVGTNSIVAGNNCRTGSGGASALGWETNANAWASHTQNYYTKANNNYSSAAGSHTKTSRNAQFVVGEYNADNKNALFIVGNGAEGNEQNAFEVLKDGSAVVNGSKVVTEASEIGLLTTNNKTVIGAINELNTRQNGEESFPLPRIRYANCKLVKNEGISPFYRFTVENLGGGTLQVGDRLQICCRRLHSGGKYKLRRMKDIEITEENINHRFLKIDVDPADDAVQKWLFRNDHKFSYKTLSPMYFRLKRVTAYDDNGQECNAVFSNVEQVWKTYKLEQGAPFIDTLKIK